ncbi:porin family protein [Tamlana haliotis]|uniref:Porin family protein n=1 Tax=Pseudotamlana haliotis TaxID=2614804 RepID=A0A6N6MT78_9FLAO|nr:outer membrane beta-barrel protein [Tamlana haliotis]KAB1071900.1 porin family protein [Tamlana haliotis]
MKKFTLLLVFTLILSASTVFGQARKELNFGLIGVNYEIPIHKDITIAPAVATDLDLDWINLGVKANYYFDNLFGITDDAWDVYGGANAGYAIYNGHNDDYDNDHHDSSFDVGLQVGGRWFWNEKWGVYAEISGGSTIGAIPSIGVTMKL